MTEVVAFLDSDQHRFSDFQPQLLAMNMNTPGETGGLAETFLTLRKEIEIVRVV
jgi:hypothetical protein